MFAMAQYPETVAILLEAYENSKLGKKRLADIITGFIDPNAADTPPTPPAPVVKAEDEDSDDADESDEEEEAVDTGPDPLVTAEKFAEMQALYDKAWDSLLKLGSSHPKTQAKREAVASHIMTLKLSPKIVDEITQNLRAKIDTVRQTEKSIMRICVVDAGMTREDFIKIYRSEERRVGNEWVRQCRSEVATS